MHAAVQLTHDLARKARTPRLEIDIREDSMKASQLKGTFANIDYHVSARASDIMHEFAPTSPLSKKHSG